MVSTVDRCREALSSPDEARLVELAADRSEWVRACVPLNPAAPRELLRACLSDRSWRVVAAVAARMAPDAPFWNDAGPLSDQVAGWLATCGSLTEEWALRLARHKNISVREPLAFSTPWLSAQARLSRDPTHRVRTALARSHFLLPVVRHVLAADSDEDVRSLAGQRFDGTSGARRAGPLAVTDDDLMTGALRQPGFGAAAAVQFGAMQEHDRVTDATRQRILSGQLSMPWPAQQGSVVEAVELHAVAVSTDVAGHPEWLTDADGFMEQIASVLTEIGGLLEDHQELGGELVITATVPTAHTAQRVAGVITASTNVRWTAQPDA